MEKTILNIKTEKELKEKARKTAQELGLPLSTIINAYLRDLTREKRVVFSVPPEPNKKLQKLIKEVRRDIAKRKKTAKPLNYDQAVKYLDKI